MSTLDLGGWEPSKVVPSPDGTSTAVLASTRRSLYNQVLIVRDGELAVVTAPTEQATNVAWMPDSKRVLVSFYRSGALALRLHPLEGRAGETVTLETDIGSATGMAVATDGRTAYMGAPGRTTRESEPNDLFQVDLISGRVENLTNTPVESEDSPSFIDDHRVAFNGGQLTTSAGGPNGYAAVFDLRTRAVSRLTEADETVTELAATTRGGWLVFRSFPRNERGQAGVHVLQADTGRRQRLDVDEGAHQPRFSAAGDEVVYVKVGGPGDRRTVETIPLSRP